MYGKSDPKYLDQTSGFVLAQTYVNIAEMFLGAVGIFLHLGGSVQNALLLAFTSNLMTLSKTVLYFLMDFFDATAGGQNVFHKAPQPIWYLFNVPWIIVPLLATISLFSIIKSTMTVPKEKKN
jgi:hypothetical protein